MLPQFNESKILKLAEYKMKRDEFTLEQAMKLARVEAIWDEFYWIVEENKIEIKNKMESLND